VKSNFLPVEVLYKLETNWNVALTKKAFAMKIPETISCLSKQRKEMYLATPLTTRLVEKCV